MKVLVTAASRHGATQAISHEIARELRAAGHSARVLDPVEVDDLGDVDAVVLGSAVYRERWLPEARNLAARLTTELEGRPVWLFSSGPVGTPPRPRAEAVDVARVGRQTHARGHHLFAGRIDESVLSPGERAAARGLRVRNGDFRDWHEIRCWAGELASQLATQTDTSSDPDWGSTREDV